MTNILFVNIPAIPWNELKLYSTHKNTIYSPLAMPMGLLYLSACVKAKFGNQHKVQLLDYRANLDKILNYSDTPKIFFSGLATELVKFEPDIISITLNFACAYQTFVYCVQELKRTYPHSCIIVGGIQASNTVEHLITNQNIDYVMCGEGEIAFPQCVSTYEKIKNLTEIKGVYSKDKLPGKKRVITDMVEDLDTIPYPDWDILDMDVYICGGRQQGSGDSSIRTATVITSRGCPFKCTFCSSHTIHGRKTRTRSVENVIGEIKELNKSFGINLITFEDDLITSNKKRTIEIFSTLKQLKFKNFKIEFPDILSINTTDNEVLDIMVENGLSVAIFALESGSSYTQKHIIKKNVNLEKTHAIVNHLRNNHPEVIIRCMLLFGFPHETKELMQESLSYAKTLALDWVAFNPATPLPGSEMYDQFIEMGAIKDIPETWERCHFGVGSRNFDTPEMSAAELNEFIYMANLDVNFKNNYNIRSGNFSRALQQFEGIVKKYNFHIIAWYSILYCYKKINDTKNVELTEKIIKKILESDERAITMYEKYGQYIPQ
jgi:radical SAM superfamily enzyme YgiQ (UPF0313 family)